MLTAAEIIEILQKVPENSIPGFLCPDGFEDAFYTYKIENENVTFGGYKTEK